MIIITLKGGLGNQMFQYAAAKSLATLHNTSLYLNIGFLDGNVQPDRAFTPRSFELGMFNISEKIINLNINPHIFNTTSIKNRLMKKIGLRFYKIYTESTHRFNPSFFNTLPPVLLNGFYQSEKYFQAIRENLMQTFRFPVDDISGLRQFENQITSCNSVSIHVRRGDYVTLSDVSAFHGICNIEYYQPAINLMDKLSGNAHYFIFSDDIDWASQNLLLNDRSQVVDTRHMPSWCDMYLMSVCKNNIIANSSYSWWGAWLNKNSNKIVIAPEKWFADKNMNNQTQDLLPSTWFKI